MGHIDLLSACYMSFPEVLLIIITSCLIIGRREILNLKDKTNLLKLFITSILMTIAVVTVRNCIGQNTALISLSLYIFIWIAIYRIGWLEAVAGILITSIAFMALEYVSIIIGCQAIGVHFNGSTIDSRLFIYLSFVTRLLETVFAIILYKLPFTIIDIGSIKDFTKSTWKNIIPILVFEAFYIFTILKIARLDYNITTIWGVLSLVTSIIAMLALNAVVLYIVIKLMRVIIEERKNKVIAYLNYQRLRKKHGDDIIAIDKEIDIALQKAVKDYRSKNIWGGKKRDK